MRAIFARKLAVEGEYLSVVHRANHSSAQSINFARIHCPLS